MHDINYGDRKNDYFSASEIPILQNPSMNFNRVFVIILLDNSLQLNRGLLCLPTKVVEHYNCPVQSPLYK